MTLTETDARFLGRNLARDFLLWPPKTQDEGYLHWDKIWATRTIPRGTARPYASSDRLGKLTFESVGETFDVDRFIDHEFVSGLLVLKDREILLERYARGLTPEGRWQSSSMVKSLTSILFGIAIHDGAVKSVEEPVVNYLPELKDSAYEGVTIRDLLHMASGVAWTEDTENPFTDVSEHYIQIIADRIPDYILGYLKSRPRANPPGTQYYYNTGDVFLLGLILSRSTGKSMTQLCAERFWEPMGCEHDGYFLLDSDDGHEVAGSCCGASLRDHARWAELMLNDGVAADGQRILPEGWVAESTRATAPNFAFDPEGRRGVHAAEHRHGYGYLWWTAAGGDYQARGSFGQLIHISPKHNAAVVILGAVPRLMFMTDEQKKYHAATTHRGSITRNDFINAAFKAL